MRAFSRSRSESRPSLRHAMVATLVITSLVVPMATVLAQAPPVPDASTVAPPATPAEAVPPRPAHWFTDDAKATSPGFAHNLERRLAGFEHETTDQFVVVILPRLPSSDSLEGYCRQVFNAWGIGRKGINNGVVLFVFLEDHKLRIQVGRGLETPLTDPVCQEIVRQMLPAFRHGDFEGGITTGVDAIITILRTPPPQPTPRAES